LRFSLFERLNRVCGATLGLSWKQTAASKDGKGLNLKALKVKSLAYDVLGYARLFSANYQPHDVTKYGKSCGVQLIQSSVKLLF
jgi:hypothetical protein